MEELVHEALCFDMTVEQPWPVIKRGVKGLGQLLSEATAAEADHTNGHGEAAANGTNGKVKDKGITEGILAEYSWTLLNEL